MLQLILDGRTAVIKKGTTFTITLENPALTDRGTYTLEVTLPLRGCPDNLRILGPLHRLETPLATDTHLTDGGTFHLISPPAIDLTGTWRVTSLTDTEAKVQLTAGRHDSCHQLHWRGHDRIPRRFVEYPRRNRADKAENLVRQTGRNDFHPREG